MRTHRCVTPHTYQSVYLMEGDRLPPLGTHTMSFMVSWQLKHHNQSCKLQPEFRHTCREATASQNPNRTHEWPRKITARALHPSASQSLQLFEEKKYLEFMLHQNKSKLNWQFGICSYCSCCSC